MVEVRATLVSAAVPFSFRPILPVALALLCTACSTPEEKADAAFSELTAVVRLIRSELARMTGEPSALSALPQLEEQAEALRDLLARIDELALDPEMTPEARRRVGEAHHAPLRAATDEVLEEVARLARHQLYHVEGLKRLARREYAHYSTRGIHPWARAVLEGREYRPKPKRK